MQGQGEYCTCVEHASPFLHQVFHSRAEVRGFFAKSNENTCIQPDSTIKSRRKTVNCFTREKKLAFCRYFTSTLA